MRNLDEYVIEAQLKDLPEELQELKAVTFDNLSAGYRKESVWNKGKIKLANGGITIDCPTTRTDCFLKFMGPKVNDEIVSKLNIVKVVGSRNTSYPVTFRFDNCTSLTSVAGMFSPDCKIQGGVRFIFNKCTNLSSLEGLPKGDYKLDIWECDRIKNLDGVSPDAFLTVYSCAGLNNCDGEDVKDVIGTIVK